MYFSVSLLAALATLNTVLAQSSDLPSCISTCIDENPTLSWCDGDETGAELEECTCQSLRGSLMIQCMTDCSTSDQAAYAANISDDCAAELFPDVNGGSNNDDNEEASSTTASPSAASTTAPSDTESTTAPSNTESTAGPEATNASGDDSGEPDAAAGLSVSVFLAAGGFVAAFFL